MQHVYYRPVYGTVPRAYNRALSVFPSNKPRVVNGSRAYNGTLSVFSSNKPRVVNGSQPKRNRKNIESSE